jgi:hypothetical protein
VWRHELTIVGEGTRSSVDVPVFWKVAPPPVEPPASQPVAAAVAPPAPPPAPVAVAVADEASPGLGTQRTVALVAGSAGAAAIVLGSVFGLSAKSAWDDSRPHCDASNACDATGHGLVQDAQSRATLSTVLFVAGTASLATGVVLWLTGAPEPRPARTDVGLTIQPGAVAWQLRGRF